MVTLVMGRISRTLWGEKGYFLTWGPSLKQTDSRGESWRCWQPMRNVHPPPAEAAQLLPTSCPATSSCQMINSVLFQYRYDSLAYPLFLRRWHHVSLQPNLTFSKFLDSPRRWTPFMNSSSLLDSVFMPLCVCLILKTLTWFSLSSSSNALSILNQECQALENVQNPEDIKVVLLIACGTLNTTHVSWHWLLIRCMVTWSYITAIS